MPSVPVRITWLHVHPSDFINERIEQKADKLARIAPVLEVRATFEPPPHKGEFHGGLWRVRLELDVKGTTLVVGSEEPADPSHESTLAAVDDAFKSLRRQLSAHLGKKRETKKRVARKTDGGKREARKSR